MGTEIEGSHKSPSMEKEEDKDDFVLRSGVRAGLKREFAFAIASQAALAPSSSLGRSRTRSRTSSNSVAAPSPKRPRSRPPDPQPARDPTASPPGDPAAEAPVLALLAVTPKEKEELPVKPPDGDDVFFIPPESPPRRITRSMLKPPPPTPQLKLKPKPKPKQEEEEEEEDHNDGQYQPGGVGGITRRRFTRSLLLKDKGGDDDLSGTTTASDSSSASLNSNKNMELKMSKKISLNKIPKNLKELLATGLLEGQPVKYIMRKGKRAVLRGIIKRIGILCSCSSCKGRNVVSPYYFEVHAGSTKKHPSDYIFLQNGNNLHDILRACANATLDMLESAIQNAIGPAPQKRTFRCQTCKSSFRTLRAGKFASLCDSCLESKGDRNSTRSSKIGRSPSSSDRGSKNASPGAKTASAGRLTRKDKGLHKLVFMSGVLPEGTDVGYYVGGKRLLDGYIKEFGIYCHCCGTVVSPSQFEAHAGRAARRKP